MAYPARHAAVRKPIRKRLRFFSRRASRKTPKVFVAPIHETVTLKPVVLPSVKDIPYNTQYGGVRPLISGAVTMGWISLDRK